MDRYERTCLLIGKENLKKLKNSSVAVFGVGGVGGFTVEALARSGIGKITVFDGDTVALSNLNRQIIATENNVGENKVDVIKERVKSIDSSIEFCANKTFVLPDNSNIDFTEFDYVVDAVDTVSAKLFIIESCTKLNVPVISCMGTGGKIEPTMIKVGLIEETEYCPLARVIRRELKKRNVKNVKVVYSTEKAFSADGDDNEKTESGKNALPSMIFVPATAGIIIAGEIVKDLIKR